MKNVNFKYMTTDDIEASTSEERNTWHHAKAREALDENKLHECIEIIKRIDDAISDNKTKKIDVILHLPDIVGKLNEYLEIAYPGTDKQTARVMLAIKKTNDAVFAMENNTSYIHKEDNASAESTGNHAKGKRIAMLFLPEIFFSVQHCIDELSQIKEKDGYYTENSNDNGNTR